MHISISRLCWLTVQNYFYNNQKHVIGIYEMVTKGYGLQFRWKLDTTITTTRTFYFATASKSVDAPILN